MSDSQKQSEVAKNETMLQLREEIKVELRRIGECRNGERVETWCNKAGYFSFETLDEEGLKALKNVLQQQPTKECCYGR